MRLRLWLLVLLGSASSWLFAAGPYPLRVIGGSGSFVREAEGWKCTATQPKYVPALFSSLQVGDVVLRIGNMEVRDKGPLSLSEALRRTELGIATEAVVLREGQRVTLVAPPESSETRGEQQLTVAQDSPEILRSSSIALKAGDRIREIGGKSWTAIQATFAAAPPTPFMTIKFKPSTVVKISRAGETTETVLPEGVTLTAVRLPKAGDDDQVSSFLEGITLRGINVEDMDLRSTRGRWLLVHFWASWCKPCVDETPLIAELAGRSDLSVVAVGYSDSVESLAKFAATVKGLPVYVPDPVLTTEMAVNGIPFDVLISPEGRAVATISGTLPEGVLTKIVLDYIGQPVAESQ